MVRKIYLHQINSNLNPLKNYVDNGDVATEVKRLINLGQKEGYILFAGTTNTGMPSSHPTGAIHYVQYSGSSVIYLTYRYNYDTYYGRMKSTDTVPTWVQYILDTDFAIKTLDIDCQAGKTISYALNAYDHIITGVASISNNDYITKYNLVGNGLIITSTAAHAVKVYYFNRPK